MTFIVKNKLIYYKTYGDIWGLSYTSRIFKSSFFLQDIFQKYFLNLKFKKLLFFEFYFCFFFRSKTFKDLAYIETLFKKDAISDNLNLNILKIFFYLFEKNKRAFYLFLLRFYIKIKLNKVLFKKLKIFELYSKDKLFSFFFKKKELLFIKKLRNKKINNLKKSTYYFNAKRIKNLQIKFCRRFGVLGISSFADKMNYFFLEYFLKETEKVKKDYLFAFTVKNSDFFVEKKRKNFRYQSLKAVRLFYINIKYRQFQKFGKKIIKMDGVFENNYLYYLECRLVGVVYRSGFIFNLFDCITFVNQKNVLISKNYCGYLHTMVPIMEFISFRPIIKGTIYWNFYRHIVKKKIIHPPLNYYWVSYKFLTFFLLRYPEINDFVNVVPVDFFRAIGFLYKRNIR